MEQAFLALRFPLLQFSLWLLLSGIFCVACGIFFNISPNVIATFFKVERSGKMLFATFLLRRIIGNVHGSFFFLTARQHAAENIY